MQQGRGQGSVLHSLICLFQVYEPFGEGFSSRRCRFGFEGRVCGGRGAAFAALPPQIQGRWRVWVSISADSAVLRALDQPLTILGRRPMTLWSMTPSPLPLLNSIPLVASS